MFLHYDSRDENQDDTDRLLIFTTENNLEILRKSGTWLADGSFDRAPGPLYSQFYSFSVEQHPALPLAFALLKDKKQETYSQLFRNIFDLVGDSPSKLVIDFEKAVENACKAEIENALKERGKPIIFIQGCFFHHTTDISKNIRSKCHTSCYGVLHYLRYLAFLPPTLIKPMFEMLKRRNVFNQIVRDENNRKDLFDYLVRTWIGGTTVFKSGPKKGEARDVKKPSYPPEMWSIYSAIKNRNCDTTNGKEAFHRGFTVKCPKNPHLILFIVALKRQQLFTEITLQQWKARQMPTETKRCKCNLGNVQSKFVIFS